MLALDDASYDQVAAAIDKLEATARGHPPWSTRSKNRDDTT